MASPSIHTLSRKSTLHGLAACVLGLYVPAIHAAEPTDTAGPDAPASATTTSAVAEGPAPSGALLLPFRAAPLADDVGRARIEWVMQSQGDGLNPPDLHFSSKLRTRDDSGHHNDFRLKHSGNLLHIPLAP